MTWPGQEHQGGGQPYPWGQTGQPGGYPPPPPGSQGPTAPGGYHPPPPGPPGPYGPTQPAGGYPPPPGGPGSGSKATVIVVAVVALILIGGGATAFFLIRDDSGGKTPVAEQTPAETASPTGTPSPDASPSDLQGFTPPPPKVAGWQVVVSKKRNVAYDVPPDWKVETEGTVIGYERQKPKPDRVLMSGAASLRQPEFCDGEKKNIALAGVTGDDEGDQSKAAKATAQKWADLAFTSDDGKKKAKISLRPAKNLDFGKAKAVQVTADVTPGEKPGCTVPPKATVTAVAIEARQGGSVMFIVVNHQRVKGAADEQDVEKMIGSIRGAQRPTSGG